MMLLRNTSHEPVCWNSFTYRQISSVPLKQIIHPHHHPLLQPEVKFVKKRKRNHAVGERHFLAVKS
jgi:hypothetical protein